MSSTMQEVGGSGQVYCKILCISTRSDPKDISSSHETLACLVKAAGMPKRRTSWLGSRSPHHISSSTLQKHTNAGWLHESATGSIHLPL